MKQSVYSRLYHNKQPTVLMRQSVLYINGFDCYTLIKSVKSSHTKCGDCTTYIRAQRFDPLPQLDREGECTYAYTSSTVLQSDKEGRWTYNLQ